MNTREGEENGKHIREWVIGGKKSKNKKRIIMFNFLAVSSTPAFVGQIQHTHKHIKLKTKNLFAVLMDNYGNGKQSQNVNTNILPLTFATLLKAKQRHDATTMV